MARIRSIKPSFFRHELLQELEMSHAALRPMLVFAGLWGHCDAAGRFAWKPRMLKLDILPFVEFDLQATLVLLEQHNLLARYEVDGVAYGVIGSFREHQRISGKEAESGEKFPDPPTSKRGRARVAPGTQRGSTGEAPGTRQGSDGEAPGSAGKEYRKGVQEQEQEQEQEQGAGAAVTVEAIVAEWNARPWSKKVQALGEPIRKRVAARLRDHPDLVWWRALFDQVGRSDFLAGRKTDFMATLFWVLGPENLAKVEAGEYDNNTRMLDRPRSLVGML